MFPRPYIGDDFEQWNREYNNPELLPVVQFQSWRDAENPERIGGWVLRVPPKQRSGNWVVVPLSAVSDVEAFAKAREALADWSAQ
jgi:hypothetical protein